jgi:hypothetical protein
MIRKLEVESKEQMSGNILLQMRPYSSKIQLPADIIGTVFCDPSNFKDNFTKVIKEAT